MILDRFRLTDRTAVVTGAGRGIGRACAVAFAEAGADVVISSRTEEQLLEVAKEIEAVGRRAVVVPADLSDTATLPGLVDAAREAFGRLDVVVNNVGGTLPMPLAHTSEDFLEEAFHFNVTTAFALSKAALPLMLAGDGGAIINISSVMGRLRERGYLAYGTAKAAMAHMTRLMAADVSPRVRVNALSVGSVMTSALEIVSTNEEIMTQLVDKTPLKRLGEPEDIAAAALYLASPAGSWVTGKVFEVDGGIEYPNLDLNLPDITPEELAAASGS